MADAWPVFRKLLVGAFRRVLRALVGGCVVTGPFHGMRYVGNSQGSVYNAKILGTYELELHALVSSFPALGFEHFVDIGGGEGFYAVGLARLLPAKVTCFELEESGRRLIADLAQANGLARHLEILGACTPTELNRVLETATTGPDLVLCDVEGYERVLLDPATVPALVRCHLLVEVHDCFEPGIGGTLEKRFEATHTIKRINAQGRHADDFPSGLWWSSLIPTRLQVRLMAEGRAPGMYWLWMVPA